MPPARATLSTSPAQPMPPDSDAQGSDSLDAMVEYLDSRRDSVSPSVSSNIECCCGQQDCYYLVTANNLISELEENIQTAAKLGSALLTRHESSMEDARKERDLYTARITELQERNRELERENSATIEENRSLLNSLEDLNRQVSQGDAKIRELNADLDATRAELDRVTARNARMEILEAQIALFEAEQEDLRRSLTTSREEELATLARWQKAELLATELSEQCARLEQEYIEEKKRSQQLAEKLEKQQQAERGSSSSSAARVAEQISVSNFMKEILSDNAQLQAGASELRRLLIVAQDEIGSLREQVLLHQRLDPKELSASPLSHEFDLFNSNAPRELHVHHHHHHVGKERSAPRKARKTGGRSTPSGRLGSVSKRPTILGDSIMPPSPNPNPNRWSLQTAQSTVDSAASTFRDPSIFDSRPRAVEDSRPTSAGSTDAADSIQSPQIPWGVTRKSYRGRKSSLNGPPFAILNADDRPSTVSPVAEGPTSGLGAVILEMEEANEAVDVKEAEETPLDESPFIPDENDENCLSDISATFAAATATPYLATTIPGRKLVRSNSHESILEAETVPITALALSSVSSNRIPFSISSTSSVATSQPILTPATARNTPARYSSSTYNRILLQAVNSGKSGAPKRTGGSVAGWFWALLTLPPPIRRRSDPMLHLLQLFRRRSTKTLCEKALGDLLLLLESFLFSTNRQKLQSTVDMTIFLLGRTLFINV